MSEEKVRELIRKEIKNSDNDNFKDTESLLYNRKNYETFIELTNLKIEEIRKGREIVVKKYDNDIVQGGIIEYKSEIEKREDLISKLEKTVENKKFLIEYIDLALKVVENNKYYPIIELKYFENKTIEDISDILKISRGTVINQRKILISKIKAVIFDRVY